MTRRRAPVKRERSKVNSLPSRPRVRVHRVAPNDARRGVVEVFLSPTRRLMHAAIRRIEGRGVELGVQGLVHSYFHKIGGRALTLPGGVVARMFLNHADLQRRPGEIVSHECTHAGMAWARLRGADLRVMGDGPERGEELLCHAVGRLVAQVSRVCYAEGVWS